MIRISLLLLLCSCNLFAQNRNFVVQLIDKSLHSSAPHARVTISDTIGNILQRGHSDSAGCFLFQTNFSIVQLKVDSAEETCDGTPSSYSGRIDLKQVKDTVRIQLGHYWEDKWPAALVFDEGTLLFRSDYDTTGTCDFNQPDPACSGFKSLEVLIHEYKLCGPFRKLEVRSFYTTNEEKQYGDSLAVKRTEVMISYLKAQGMQNVEFVVVPIFYPTRPLKQADGSFRKEEICLISFRILEW